MANKFNIISQCTRRGVPGVQTLCSTAQGEFVEGKDGSLIEPFEVLHLMFYSLTGRVVLVAGHEKNNKSNVTHRYITIDRAANVESVNVKRHPINNHWVVSQLFFTTSSTSFNLKPGFKESFFQTVD